MNTPSIFRRIIAAELLLILMAAGIMILLPHSSALTISPPRFNESIPAGGVASFEIGIKASTPDEKKIEVPTITGECAQWVTFERMNYSLPTSIRASILVPPESAVENRSYRCDIGITPVQEPGMMRYGVSVPLTARVIGGVIPAPTTETTMIPTQTAQPPTAGTGEPKTTYAPISPIPALVAITALLWRRRQ